MVRESSHHGHLRRVYGLLPDQYDYLLQKQAGACGVCRRHANDFSTRLSVDHDHQTGEVRGLLCTFCNRYVIGRHRDPVLFDNAATYLRDGTGWFVPKKKKKKVRRK